MKYRKLISLFAAMLCLALAVPSALATTYTVYFVDDGLGLGTNCYAYIYKDDNNNNASWPGQKMEKYSMQYKGMDVYKCTFETASFVPTGVIFNVGSNSNQTNNLSFTNGTLYLCKSKSNVTTDTEPQSDFAFPQYDEMYLFGDINGSNCWPTGHTKTDMYRAYQDGKGNYVFTLHLKQTGFFRLKYKTSQYSHTNSNRDNNYVLNTSTSNVSTKVATDGAFELGQGDWKITVNVSGSNVKITKVEKTDAKPRTIYVQFGQPLLDNGKKSGSNPVAPKIFFSTTGTYNSWDAPKSDNDKNDPTFTYVPGYSDGSGHPMTQVEGPLYKYDLNDEEYNKALDFVCMFQPTSGSEWKMWAGNATNFDNGNITKYMYYQGNGTVEQSYMTYDQWKAKKDAQKEMLYIVGAGFKGLSGFTVMPDDIDNPDLASACIAVPGSRGIFYQTINVGGSLYTVQEGTKTSHKDAKGAAFKMSWIRPYDWFIQNGRSGGQMDKERSWATFNLGLVGYNKEHTAVTSKKLNPTVSYIEDNSGDNPSVFCIASRSIPMNNINQYNWFIRESNISDTKPYTLVVDLDDECQSVTLLPFAPNPTLVEPSMDIESHRSLMGYADADKLRTDKLLNAEAGNGKALFTDYNIATLSCTVNAPDYDKIKSGTDGAGIAYSYDVDFDIYSDGKRVGRYEGSPSKISLAAIEPTFATKVGVRAKYTDNNTDITFHSKYAETSMSGGFEAVSATIEEVPYKTFTNGNINTLANEDRNDRRYTLGAYAEVTVGHPATERVWYPDFQLTNTQGYHQTNPSVANGGEVVHSTHTAKYYKDKEGNDVENENVKHLSGYNPWAEGAEFGESHDWAKKLTGTTTWPLYLQDVVEVKRNYYDDEKPWLFEEDSKAARLNVKVTAVYPFLIDNDAVATGTSTTELSAPRRAMTLTPGHSYSIHMVRAEPEGVNVDFDDKDLTGVNEIEAAPAETGGETEYYTLQGVRVRGELVPGVYISRRGTTVEKIIIR